MSKETKVQKETNCSTEFMKKIQTYFESYYNEKYNSDKNSILYDEFKHINWLSQSGTEGLHSLVYLNNVYGDTYNAVDVKEQATLTKNNRIKIIRNNDLLKGIKIACVDPEKDIKKVTLFISIILPKEKYMTDAFINKFDITNYRKIMGQCLYGNCDEALRKKVRVYYIPIKIIESPKNKYVEFFKYPIYLACETSFAMSIDVEYKTESINQCKKVILYSYVVNKRTKFNEFYHDVHSSEPNNVTNNLILESILK